jgi:hypothetical protein
MIAARVLILLGAICFTLVAAYQWTYFTTQNRRTLAWSAAVAVILWLVWFYTMQSF